MWAILSLISNSCAIFTKSDGSLNQGWLAIPSGNFASLWSGSFSNKSPIFNTTPTNELLGGFGDLEILREHNFHILDEGLDFFPILALEGSRTEEHFVGHDAETPVVVGDIEGFVLNQLRCFVSQKPYKSTRCCL